MQDFASSSDETKQALKCIVREGRFVEPCASLLSATEYGGPYGKRKGIYAWALTAVDTGPTRTMFGAKSGDHVANGMLFNFCPFCGEKIDAPFNNAGDAS